MATDTERDIQVTDSENNKISFSFTTNPGNRHEPAPKDFHAMKLQCAGQDPQDLAFDQFKPLIDQIGEAAVSGPDHKAIHPMDMDLAGGINLPVGHFKGDWDISPGPTPLQTACTPKISSKDKPRTIG